MDTTSRGLEEHKTEKGNRTVEEIEENKRVSNRENGEKYLDNTKWTKTNDSSLVPSIYTLLPPR